jgi:hypothetical protein
MVAHIILKIEKTLQKPWFYNINIHLKIIDKYTNWNIENFENILHNIYYYNMQKNWNKYLPKM